MSEPVYWVDDKGPGRWDGVNTHYCLGCEVMLPPGVVWCDPCIYATETLEESIAMYQANGMNLMEAVVATLRDAYEQRHIADSDASRPNQLSDWLPCTDGPEDIPF